MDINAQIIPYFSAAGFTLYSEYTDIESGKYVDLNEEFFRIDIGDTVSLFYAKPNMKLFRICVYPGYKGTLNGIQPLGKSEDELYELFPGLWYDDFEELFFPDPNQGFYFETDPETHLVHYIAVYIKEMESDEIFFNYEW